LAAETLGHRHIRPRHRPRSRTSGNFKCQLTDVEAEANGLLSFDRAAWKVDPDAVAAALRAARNAVPNKEPERALVAPLWVAVRIEASHVTWESVDVRRGGVRMERAQHSTADNCRVHEGALDTRRGLAAE
jgi:hypothetical protein